VQGKRELPTRVIQTFQMLAQKVVMARLRKVGTGGEDLFMPPLVVRMLLKIPVGLALPARLIGWGLRPPHMRGAGERPSDKGEGVTANRRKVINWSH